MGLLAEFHFLRPWWLAALLPLVFLVWRLRQRARANAHWQQICDPALLPYLLLDSPRPERRRSTLAFALGGLLGVIAMAGPTFERLAVPVYRDRTAYVLVLDLSPAMLATDLSPTRLDRAKYKIKDLLGQRRHGQVGLVVFAAQAFVVTPLTADGNTVAAQLPALSPEIMPVPGRNVPPAIAKAAALLEQAGAAGGDILLITSDVPPAQREAAASATAGFRLSVLGVGTPEGAPVPKPAGGFSENDDGQIVMERLDGAALAELARRGGGVYAALGHDDRDVAVLAAFFDRHAAPTAALRSEARADQWRESGPWLLLPLLACAAFAFRRGIVACCCLGVCLFQVRAVDAGWWLTPDQEARRAFETGEYDRAAETFSDPVWRAAALYRAGRFDAAAEVLKSRQGIEANYNLGNALAKAGRYQDAIAAYDRVLQAAPDHPDASYNKALVEKQLEKAPPEQQPKDQQQSGDQQQDRQRKPDQGAGSSEQQRNAAGDKEGQDSGGEANRNAERPRQRPQDQQGGHGTQDRPDRADEDPATAGGDSQDRDRDAEQTEQPVQAAESERTKEAAIATEQWLRQIPDDPGGLLRRKFKYLYNRDAGEGPAGDR